MGMDVAKLGPMQKNYSWVVAGVEKWRYVSDIPRLVISC